MKCLICEKELKMMEGMDMPNNPDCAGEVDMHFHYGSRHDGYGLPLFDCPESVKAYICDDCFEQKKNLCVMGPNSVPKKLVRRNER